jgi:hypothetical protein
VQSTLERLAVSYRPSTVSTVPLPLRGSRCHGEGRKS